MTVGVDGHEFRQIIAGLGEGAIPVEPDRTIACADPASLYRKLDVHKRSEAIVWGREHGFPLAQSGK